MKLETELTSFDRALLAEATDGFLPPQVIDFHAHVMDPRFYARDAVNPAFAGRPMGFPEYTAALELLLGPRLVGEFVFPYPARRTDRAGVNAWMTTEARAATTPRHRLAALVAPSDDPGLAGEWLRGEACCGLKPYHLYANEGDTRQTDIEDWAPEWMWRCCHEHEAMLILHLVKDASSAHPANQEALLRLSTRYPGCRVVLAHVGRSFNHRTARGLKALASRSNIVVDTSAITESEGIKIAFDVLGVDRVLYGSDYPISHVRGRCVTAGDSFQWIYGEEMNNPRMTLVGIESLLSHRQAAEDLGLSRTDIEKLFYANARALLG